MSADDYILGPISNYLTVEKVDDESYMIHVNFPERTAHQQLQELIRLLNLEDENGDNLFPLTDDEIREILNV